MRFKSPLQIPLSSGLLSERRAAQGCSGWREHTVLAWPRKCHVHCWEGSAITYNCVAQYSGSCVCDETQKLRHLLFCQQTSQMPLELTCFQVRHGRASPCQQVCASLSEGVHCKWQQLCDRVGKNPSCSDCSLSPENSVVCWGLFLCFPIHLQMRERQWWYMAAILPLCWLKPHVHLRKVTTDWLIFSLVLPYYFNTSYPGVTLYK